MPHFLLRLALLLVVALVCGVNAFAQSGKSFQGEWEWAIYATRRDQLPPAYRNEPLKDVPAASVYLKLKQRGNKLSGEYSASRRYLAKLEEGDLSAVVKGNTTQLELTSGFGGTVTVLLTLQRNRMHWKTIKADGEQYFPDDVFLRRVVRRRRVQR